MAELRTRAWPYASVRMCFAPRVRTRVRFTPSCGRWTARIRGCPVAGRHRLVADAYGLDRDGRAELLTAMNDAIDRVEAAVRRSVDAVTRTPSRCGTGPGGSERYDRRRRWWMDHHHRFAAALL